MTWNGSAVDLIGRPRGPHAAPTLRFRGAHTAADQSSRSRYHSMSVYYPGTRERGTSGAALGRAAPWAAPRRWARARKGVTQAGAPGASGEKRVAWRRPPLVFKPSALPTLPSAPTTTSPAVGAWKGGGCGGCGGWGGGLVRAPVVARVRAFGRKTGIGVMGWWEKVVFPVRRVWTAVAARVKAGRKSGESRERSHCTTTFLAPRSSLLPSSPPPLCSVPYSAALRDGSVPPAGAVQCMRPCWMLPDPEIEEPLRAASLLAHTAPASPHHLNPRGDCASPPPNHCRVGSTAGRPHDSWSFPHRPVVTASAHEAEMATLVESDEDSIKQPNSSIPFKFSLDPATSMAWVLRRALSGCSLFDPQIKPRHFRKKEPGSRTFVTAMGQAFLVDITFGCDCNHSSLHPRPPQLGRFDLSREKSIYKIGGMDSPKILVVQ
ncbi:hypothetical protein Taro_034406 [Colocasia esculenta]|uniref:Uncharacterized protein n=1 Tax=Colocasia esculenta TaxID=4460 RepID=A0A843W9Y1_COLES|nr:hypothetical protein [Colocasia esculenta]